MKTLISVFAFLFISALLAMAGDYQIIRSAPGTSPGGGSGTNIAKLYIGQDVSGAELIEVFVWNLAQGTTTVSRVIFDGALTNKVATITNSGTTAISSANTIAKMWKSEDYFLFNCDDTHTFKFGGIMRGHKIGQ